MILQSLSKAIREQNYYAVLLEFVIVIAGVVIGFQIQAWNEQRQLREQEAIYLEQVQADLNDMIDHIENRGAWLTRQIENLRISIDALNDCRIDEAAEQALKAALSGHDFFEVRYVVDSTYQEMLASGALARMDNTELKRRINRIFASSRWHEVYVSVDVSPVEAASEVINDAVPFSLPDDNDLSGRQIAPEFELERLCSDFRLTNALIQLREVAVTFQYTSRFLLGEMQAAESLLAESMKAVP